MNPALCYIAIIADDETCSLVKALQQTAADNFDSSRALRSPPHITLEPPFKWNPKDLQALESQLQLFAAQQKPFSIRLRGFNKFPSRVIFLDVEDNQQLQRLQNNLKIHLRAVFNLVSERPDRPFRPHMTVAFKDLRKNRFSEAWEYFSRIEFHRVFDAEKITLLQHDGQRWQQRCSFVMKGRQP